MKHVPILAILRTKKIFLSAFIILALVSSVFISLLTINNAGASPYTDEYTDVDKKIKAIKYFGLIKTCTSDTPGVTGGYVKTTISGTDIDNGARWWTTDPATGGINIGVYLDSWGDKNGVTQCNGESDSEPGWLNDAFKVFGIPIPSKSTANVNTPNASNPGGRRNFLELNLGYKCTKSSSQYDCTNSTANDAATTATSWQGKIKALPYFGGTDPLTITEDRDAMTYYLAYAALKNPKQCNAAKGGNGNLVKVAEVKPDGTITTSDWGIKNDGGLTRVANSGLPLGVQGTWGTGGKTCQDMATYTVNNKEEYQAWSARQACAKGYPAKISDLTFLTACGAGWLSPTDYVMCSKKPATGYQGSTFNPGGRNACFLGQGLPVDPNGVTAGELCMALGYTTDPELSACIKGAIHRSEPDYCSKTYYTGYYGAVFEDKKEQLDACIEGQTQNVTDGTTLLASTITTGTNGAGGAGGDPTTSCAIEGVGWIVCPIINFMAGANDVLYGLLSGLLATDTEIVDANDTNPAYNAWQVARNFANVGFVIVFLIIIFSQISSIGISNYGVKRMLPRMIIAAILVNLSFIVCALAVDVSNILGGSVVQLFDSIAVFGQSTNASDSGTLAGQVLAGGVVLVAGLSVGAAALSAGSLLLPVLAAALLAIIVTVFILATRKVVIILLIVLAPLAFLAMLLPNTENLFKQWRKMLVAMLLVYPMIGLLFGASTLASKIIVGSGTDGLQQIIGIIVLFVPLLLTPSLLQASLKAIPALGGFASKLADRANSNLSGSANKRLRPLLDSALSNRSAGLTWGGRERVKRGFTGAKLDKDGNVIAGSRRLFGAKTKLDEHGHPVTQKPARRNFSQVLGDRGKVVEKNIETNKRIAENNFAQGGIDGSSRTGRKTGKVLDRAQTAGLDQKRVDELYVGRLKNRQINNGKERGLTAQLEDAETTVGALDNIIKEEGQIRIEHGAANTAAAAIGVEGMTTELNIDHKDAEGNVISSSVEQVGLNNLADVSKVGFAASEGTKAAELQIQRNNKESGVANSAVQEQKRAEKAIKVNDTQQEAVFKGQTSGPNPDEELINLSNQQDAAERATSTLDAEEKSRLENVARNDEMLEDLEKRKQTAEQEVAVIHAQEDAELQRRKAPGGDLADLTAEEVRAKLDSENAQNAQKSAAEDSKLPDGENADLFAESIIGKVASDKTAAEQRRIENEARFGTNQQITNADGTTTTLFTENELSNIVTADQDTQAATEAGSWAEGGTKINYAAEIDSGSDRGEDLAVAASGAKVKNKEGIVQTDDQGKRRISKIVQAKASKVGLDDDTSDEDVIVSLAKTKTIGLDTALARIGLDANGKPLPADVAKDVPDRAASDAERRGYYKYIIQSADESTIQAATTYVGSLPAMVDEKRTAFEQAATQIESIRKSGGTPDESVLEDLGKKQKEYEDAEKYAQRMQTLYLEGPMKPPWVGGSDKGALSKAQFRSSNEEAAMIAFIRGKVSGSGYSGANIVFKNTMAQLLNSPEAPALLERMAAREGMTVDAAKKALAKNIIAIDQAQFQPDLNGNLQTRDVEQFDKMRDGINSLTGGIVPDIATGKVNADGTPDIKPYTGYIPADTEVPPPPTTPSST